jgi:hypothetical protein
MAFKKAKNQAENGRPLTGTKASRRPKRVEKKAAGHLTIPIMGKRMKMTAITTPPASWRNCFRVMSPTRRNS